MKNRARIVSGLAALAALFLAPLAEASLSRVSAAERAIEAPALTPASPAPEPSEFSLFEGHELTAAAAESERAPSFHPLAAVSLLSKDEAEAPLVSADELIYPKTRYRVFDFLGAPLVGVERGVSLELRWGCADFSCGFASGTVGWLSQDPLGDKDSPNLYGFVGARPHEATDPLGTCLGLDNVPCWDYATELVKVPFYNVRDVVVLAGTGVSGAVDLASGGRISAAKKAYDTFQATPGSTGARVDAAAAAYSRQQTNVMTLGFSEAPNKLQHAGDLVGIGAIDRGTTRLFNGIVNSDFDAAGRGFAEAAGGTGQLASTVAAVYAPFAPKAVTPPPLPEQLLTKGGRYETLTQAPISGISRSAHRASANRALMEMLESDPQFAEYLSKELGRDVIEHMKTGKNGLRNPPRTEWHHPLENPDVMHLLRREVHRHPALQDILNDAEGGGYAKHYGSKD